jgi:beta-phosphoglucomutase-like phosphatase (HAD superfamily)
MLQAVFFDFDGVIADSEPLHLRAYQSVLQRDNIDLTREEYYQRYLGYDDVGLFQALAKDRGLTIDTARIDDWIEAKAEIVEELLSGDGILFPGAANCVKLCAARVPLAVASGALEPEIELVLDHAGLRDYFRAIASASDGVRGKPAPDLYLLAMAKLREVAAVEPRSSVAIEDSRWGLEAARSAGMRSVAVTHTYPASELSAADLVVERLSDITIARLEGIVGDDDSGSKNPKVST